MLLNGAKNQPADEVSRPWRYFTAPQFSAQKRRSPSFASPTWAVRSDAAELWAHFDSKISLMLSVYQPVEILSSMHIYAHMFIFYHVDIYIYMYIYIYIYIYITLLFDVSWASWIPEPGRSRHIG